MLGFACKINLSHGVPDPKSQTRATTITWLNSQTPARAHEKLASLLESNLVALENQLKFVASRPQHLRMFRMTSDLLPAYSHDTYMPFYFSNEVIGVLERRLLKLGDYARLHNIRLSFHPGQFCVLASETAQTVENSITEFEYHADVIRYMGYGKKFQDFKCNVHVGGRLGPNGIKRAFKRLSQEARNTITIENAEFSWGLDASLELADTCALVLDVHHDWIHSDRYISASSDHVKRVQDSWRGVKPVVHYSQSRVLEETNNQGLPFINETGFSRMKLRAHSDYYYNNDLNDCIRQHYEWADIMCEAKEKNLAVDKLAARWGL